ncbi:Vacuolar protein sorting-associated protein 18 -like protein [Toxocara canis]|uniref:Vacuolar protein sorting-associated protein 18 homolog n=1 Tax=Toxocara canis TaxID=6265 RepID=A0A0B2VMU7_TOXCA|nr:Vacuolar protein sorting-associated protein 18 -like protein [Toxocara canis]
MGGNTTNDENALQQGIFVGKPIDFRPKGQITHLRASNGEMLLVIGARQLMHVPLQNMGGQTDIALPLPTHDRIAYVHMDVNGHHALISSTTGENFYVSLKTNLQKVLTRLKGHVISAVGWNVELSTKATTGFIVVGTNKGSLIETQIQSDGNLLYSKELVRNLSGEKDMPITDIELVQCSEEGDKQRWAVFICTPGRLYSVAGSVDRKTDRSMVQPVVGAIWNSTFMEEATGALQSLFSFKDPPRYHCMDDSQRTLPSAFVLYPKSSSGIPASKFCWIGVNGYTIGRIDINHTDPYSMLIEDAHVQHRLVDGRYDYPLDSALTEYHVLLLYSDRLEAVSLLNQKCMFQDARGSESRLMRGMCRDPISELVWVYTDSNVTRYRPNEEGKSVWRIHLERGEYDKAMAITDHLKDRAPHQLVLKKQADKFIAEKKYIAAAELLAQSSDPFEVSVLNFLSTADDRRDGLKRFLDLQLNKMTASEDMIRRDALVFWLLDVQLTELAELRQSGGRRSTLEPETGQAGVMTPAEIRLKNVKQQLELFFERPVVSESIKSNREAVYKLMMSHADFDSQLALAQRLQDYETVIDIYLLQSQYKKALEVIQNQHIPMFYYKYSSVLIEQCPFELIAAWINEDTNLQADLLLPSLYRCQREPKMIAAALKYIKFVIGRGTASKSIHNFMISLSSTYKPNELFAYFEKCGLDKTLVPYDVEFALRVCLEKTELKQCSVHLYCVDGLYDEAVSLALTFDVELAKKCAMLTNESAEEESDLLLLGSNGPRFPLEMRRRIWMKIARFVIEEQKDVEAAMKLLKDSKDVIKIQDLLPFFPEFTTIEHFKDPLCACLKEHSGKIMELQREMKEATEVADEIHKQMAKLKKRSAIIRASDTCALCYEQALTRPVFAFACRHFFHRDCLEKEVKSEWTEEDHAKFAKLSEKEKVLQKQLDDMDKKQISTPKKRKECGEELADVRKTMRDMTASECLLCGPAMIESVSKPFFASEEDYEAELKTW